MFLNKCMYAETESSCIFRCITKVIQELKNIIPRYQKPIFQTKIYRPVPID